MSDLMTLFIEWLPERGWPRAVDEPYPIFRRAKCEIGFRGNPTTFDWMGFVGHNTSAPPDEPVPELPETLQLVAARLQEEKNGCSAQMYHAADPEDRSTLVEGARLEGSAREVFDKLLAFTESELNLRVVS